MKPDFDLCLFFKFFFQKYFQFIFGPERNKMAAEYDKWDNFVDDLFIFLQVVASWGGPAASGIYLNGWARVTGVPPRSNSPPNE